jgi:hypothetical protein
MMSHWDFGRSPDEHHDAPRPAGPSRAAYPPDLASGLDHDVWPAQERQPAPDGWPDGRDGSPENPWPPSDDGWSTDDGWAGDGERLPASGWPADDAWADGDDEDEDGAPYPLTYERDDFAGPGPEQSVPPPAPWEPWPPVPYPGDSGDPQVPGTPGITGDPEGGHAATWADDDSEGRAPGGRLRGLRRGRAGTPAAADGSPGAEFGLPGAAPGDWADGGGGRASWYAGQGRGGRRWLLPAGIAVAGAAVGVATILLTSGHPAAHGGEAAGGLARPAATPGTRTGTPAATAPSPAAPSPGPLTLAQAQGVLAGYTTANNSANAQRSDTLLAAVETASSYAIDAGMYQAQQAAGTAPFPAFAPVQATYYIPRDEPATGARWFVVQVANAFTADPNKVTSTEYLLFTQSSPGGAWQNVVEPYLLTGATAPQVEVGADGLAAAVSADAATVSVAPGQLAATTAASLDGTGTGQAVADPGNLADKANQQLWQDKVPGGQVTDMHSPAAGADGQEFALLTTGGGALVFYTDAAQVTITPPAGTALHLTIPGLYSPGQALSQAGVSYLEQFAAYDPPAGSGTPRVVADYSGITGKN